MELNIPQESPSEKPAPVSNAEPRFAKIPVEKLMPYPGQPRRAFRPGSIQAMAESLKINGQQTALKVMSIPEETKAQFAPCEYMILGGHRRWEGAKLAGLKTLDTVIYDLTPEEADLAAQLDNELDPLTWLDKDLAMARRIKVFNLSTREVAREKGIAQSVVARAIKVATLLTPASIELIDQTLLRPSTEDPESESNGLTLNPDLGQSESNRLTPESDYEVSRQVVLALAALEDPQKIEKALKVVIDQQMTAVQAKKLVEWAQSGHDLAEFQTQAKVSKGPKAKTSPKQAQTTPAIHEPPEAMPKGDSPSQSAVPSLTEGDDSMASTASMEESVTPVTIKRDEVEAQKATPGSLSPKAPAHTGHPSTTDTPRKATEALKPTSVGRHQAEVQDLSASNPKKEGATLAETTSRSQRLGSVDSTKESTMGSIETLFWDLLAGISVFKQIQKKIKAGYRPAFWEGVALFFLLLAEGASLVWKHALKPFCHICLGFGKEFLHWVKKQLQATGKEGLKLAGKTVAGILKAVFAVLFIAFIAWLVYDTIVHHGFRPLAVFEEFLDFVVQAVKLIWRVI